MSDSLKNANRLQYFLSVKDDLFSIADDLDKAFSTAGRIRLVGKLVSIAGSGFGVVATCVTGGAAAFAVLSTCATLVGITTTTAADFFENKTVQDKLKKVQSKLDKCRIVLGQIEKVYKTTKGALDLTVILKNYVKNPKTLKMLNRAGAFSKRMGKVLPIFNAVLIGVDICDIVHILISEDKSKAGTKLREFAEDLGKRALAFFEDVSQQREEKKEEAEEKQEKAEEKQEEAGKKQGEAVKKQGEAGKKQGEAGKNEKAEKKQGLAEKKRERRRG